MAYIGSSSFHRISNLNIVKVAYPKTDTGEAFSVYRLMLINELGDEFEITVHGDNTSLKILGE